jgi:ABC-type transporter Mla MlaB component
MRSRPPHSLLSRVSFPSQPEPSTGILVIDGPIAAADVPRLCDRLLAVLRASDAEVVVCDVGTLAADATTIEALARLQLTARRLGRRIRLQRTSCDLDRLLEFAGLDEVLVGLVQRDPFL